ncbi:long-chain-fatty-acid--CoA ligase [Paraburkholderia sp. Ac-20340]|uniref:long-chain-fatty-acid--CoA ligase n=1 Tax=Paraburkholderia sp. Ac-20340 TaxID=2703888 RepID=UPI00197FE0EA|nr:long-chain-fatty-acid--CoA ligase [Paraburkholderia sp. Ac-20340]MBN3854770.1 long-chain-fatty-acid--CoA ligase [Paraburkholderia sp. Ac-20340]
MQLTQSFHKAALEQPDAYATVFRQRKTTFAQFVERVSRVAGALHALDVAHGDRIGILALNSDRYLEYVFGTLWAGAVVNPVNTRWSVSEIAYSLNDCGTAILFIDETFAHLAQPLRERCPVLRHVIWCGEGVPPAGMHGDDYEGWLGRATPAADAQRSGNDLAAILYTGGTTGVPKGVMLSHANLVSNALCALAAASRPVVQAVLHTAPLFHIGAMALVFQAALRGAKHVVLGGFDPGTVIETIAAEHVNETFVVPTMIKAMLDHPGFATHKLSSLTSVLYGAAPIDSTLLQRALGKLPASQFVQLYGMTEIAPVAAVLPAHCHTPDSQKLKSAGRPAPICEIRIVDPASGEPLPTGQVGEVAVRGPSVMMGYWNKPEETAKALRNGWMHTGDGGYMDEDGYLFITDRIKDMIISGGENVYSTEVENALLAHPAVEACAVIGIPDEKWGEAVHAVIVLRAGHQLTLEEIRDHCRQLIAGYKCPRSVAFRAELPLSAAGKLLKYKLREALVNNPAPAPNTPA